ncbi:MAG: TonB-dependent receptor [Thermoanaerobaculia bacterium]|nr:TonB-dependent receptor [Thermoanaerobaculia bacterium]
MGAFVRFIAAFLFSTSLSAATISGTVADNLNRPLSGVKVSIGRLRTVETNGAGAFIAEVPAGSYDVRFTHPAFRTETRTMAAGESLEVALTPGLVETIVVSGIRADAATPVTTSEIDRQEIDAQYHQQDIPLLLRDSPSINAWAESGSGTSGYSYITMRGVTPTRINFTLDGVPLADSEDMGTYFVDFPDLAHSLQSIQLQRGVGTSTVGSPSFGGSVNLESIDLAQEEQTSARVATGSFNSRFATVGYQSGALPGGFSLYTRGSYNESDSFRESSGIRQRNLFLSAAKQNETSQLRLTGFTAREWQQLSFYATDAETLKENLRANPLQPEEKDSFGYDLAQLQYLHALPGGADMTAAVYYQRGYGWYRLFDYATDAPSLREYGLDGMLLGALATMRSTFGNVTTNYGVHVNRFRREHTRDLVDGPRDYSNYGVKHEANVFAKASVDRERWHLYGDAQVRFSSFDYHGTAAIEPISWTFFNPKIGARYRTSARSSVYASAGVSSREPARNDLFSGEDNPSVAYDLRAVHPERLIDIETGIDWQTARLTLAANLYAMEFRNEIASTGELSEIGLLLRRNVDSSYRRGIEVEASVQAMPGLRLRTNANLSRNRIGEWTQFYDVYDDGGNWVDSRPRRFDNVEPLLTPSLTINQAVEYTPRPSLSAGLVARYTGKSFLDNTNNADFVTPSFFVVDASLAYSLTKALRLSLQVNNLFDNQRVFPSGYSYLYRTDGSDQVSGTAYYYPQATRHFVVMLDVRL